MKTQAIHDSVRLLPADSVTYRSTITGSSPRPHERWGEALGESQWGWRLAFSHHINAVPLPPSIQDPNVRRAYHFLQGSRDDHMAQTLALRTNHDLASTRFIVQGLLCAKDLSFESIAGLVDLHAEVVELYEGLFFGVRSRGNVCGANQAFPMSRLGAVTEAEKGYNEAEQTLMRVGRDYGWREVARLAGLIAIEDENESPESVLNDMERTTAANARMLARAGHLNRSNSAGIRHGQSLLMQAKRARPQPQVDDPDMRCGLGSVGMTNAVMDGFMRMSRPDVEYRLALQRQQQPAKSQSDTD